MGKKSKVKSEHGEKVIYKQCLPDDSSEDDLSDDEPYRKTRKTKPSPVIMETSPVKEETDDAQSCVKEEEIFEPAETVLSSIKNRIRRQVVYGRMKNERKKAKRDLKKLKAKEEEISGVKEKKKVPDTIESKREIEETFVMSESDEDLLINESRDTYSNYYTKKYEPKVLITASDLIHGRTVKFLKELSLIIPNSVMKYRNKTGLEKVIRDAPSKGFTDLIIVNEDHRVPTGMLIIHLPDGPATLFRLSNVKICKDLKRNIKDFTGHRPEVIVNNFRTLLGRGIARMFAALFHYDPEFKGRSVCTFHNQRDYIFFRYHRYEFKNEKRVKLKELGPRFTMRLEWVRKGAFGGDYEWNLKRHEMETSRRKFFL